MKKILNGIIKENPTFVLILGLCSTLAVTTKFESSYIMGICMIIILTFSNTIVSIIKKLVPNNVRIPVYVLIIGTLVTIIEVILKKYMSDVYSILGIYLPLIVVNCIVLGRAISVASNSKITTSFLDGLGIGFGYLLSLMLIGFTRELLGTGRITIIDSLSSLTNYKIIINIFDDTLLANKLFITPAGAFLTLGIFMALFNYVKEKRRNLQ